MSNLKSWINWGYRQSAMNYIGVPNSYVRTSEIDLFAQLVSYITEDETNAFADTLLNLIAKTDAGKPV